MYRYAADLSSVFLWERENTAEGKIEKVIYGCIS